MPSLVFQFASFARFRYMQKWRKWKENWKKSCTFHSDESTSFEWEHILFNFIYYSEEWKIHTVWWMHSKYKELQTELSETWNLLEGHPSLHAPPVKRKKKETETIRITKMTNVCPKWQNKLFFNANFYKFVFFDKSLSKDRRIPWKIHINSVHDNG